MAEIAIHTGTFFSMRFDEGIFMIYIDKAIKGTPAQAWEWINCMHDIQSQLKRPFPLLTAVQQKVEFTSEARRIMRQVEDVEHFVAHAMWASSLSMKAMVKFLMILVPRNLFDEDVFLQEINARAWLQVRIKQSKHSPVSNQEASAVKLEIKTQPI